MLEYWKNSLIIVDMQQGFVPRKALAFYYMYRRKKLIENILKRVEDIKNTWGNIVLVCYPPSGENIPEIQESTHWYMRVVQLYKRTDGLLDDLWVYRENNSQVMVWVLQWKNITCVWVNTTACVARTLVGLLVLKDEIGSDCNLRVPLDSTLNILQRFTFWIMQRQNSPDYRERYEPFSDPQSPVIVE